MRPVSGLVPVVTTLTRRIVLVDGSSSFWGVLTLNFFLRLERGLTSMAGLPSVGNRFRLPNSLGVS